VQPGDKLLNGFLAATGANADGSVGHVYGIAANIQGVGDIAGAGSEKHALHFAGDNKLTTHF
jgi:hypothetical protein